VQSWDEVRHWRREQRASLNARREVIAKEERRRLQPLIPNLVKQHFPELASALVRFYWPFRGEIGPHPLVRRLVERGARAALRSWSRRGSRSSSGLGGRVTAGTRRLEHPDPGRAARCATDGAARTVGRLRPARLPAQLRRRLLRPHSGSDGPEAAHLGVGYELGRLDIVLPRPHDIPMNAVVTEAGLVKSPPWRAGTTRDSGASRASPLAWDEDPTGTGAYASPPCFMHELDPAYLGLQRNPDPSPADSMAGRKAVRRGGVDAPDAMMPRAARRK
jgi:5-formyltetrahydrofolate cyclo-ligase